MADKGPVTVRTRKFLRNSLLARRQMVRLPRSSVAFGVDMNRRGGYRGLIHAWW